MEKKVLSILVVLCITVLCKAQLTFERAIFDSSSVWAFYQTVEPTAEGGYIIPSFINGHLIKVDSTGNTLWAKTYKDTLSWRDYCYSVQQTYDGGYILAGIQDFGFGWDWIYVIKTDANGDTLWTKRFESNTQLPVMIQQTADSGYVLTGSIYSDVALIRLNQNGDILWTKTYGGMDEDYGYSVQQTTDGGYVIVGETSSFGVGGAGCGGSPCPDIFSIKTDVIGNIEWTKTYGGTNEDYGYSVQQTTDGGYIITGGTRSFGVQDSCWSFPTPCTDVYLIKTDSLGDTLWTRTIGGSADDVGQTVQQTTDGGYVIAGTTALIKTDATGNLLWAKKYPLGAGGFSARQTFDGGYFAIGKGGGLGDLIYLIKTDSAGNSGCNQISEDTITGNASMVISSPTPTISSGVVVDNTAIKVSTPAITDSVLCGNVSVPENIDMQVEYVIYPNPASDVLYVEGDFQEEVVLELYDMMGRKVKEQVINSNYEKIGVSEFSTGIYIYRLIAGDGMFTAGKVVVE